MLTIVYDEVVNPISDFDIDRYVELFIRNIKKNKDVSTSTGTSSELLILAFRVAVKEGKIDCKNIRFRFDKDIIYVDKDGRFLGPLSDGFCDHFDKYLAKLL
jgi:hypothetical protein